MIDDLADVEVWEDVRRLIDAKFPHLSGRNSAPHELAKARALSDHRLKDMKEQYSHKISMVVKKHENPVRTLHEDVEAMGTRRRSESLRAILDVQMVHNLARFESVCLFRRDNMARG